MEKVPIFEYGGTIGGILLEYHGKYGAPDRDGIINTKIGHFHSWLGYPTCRVR